MYLCTTVGVQLCKPVFYVPHSALAAFTPIVSDPGLRAQPAPMPLPEQKLPPKSQMRLSQGEACRQGRPTCRALRNNYETVSARSFALERAQKAREHHPCGEPMARKHLSALNRRVTEHKPAAADATHRHEAASSPSCRAVAQLARARGAHRCRMGRRMGRNDAACTHLLPPPSSRGPLRRARRRTTHRPRDRRRRPPASAPHRQRRRRHLRDGRRGGGTYGHARVAGQAFASRERMEVLGARERRSRSSTRGTARSRCWQAR